MVTPTNVGHAFILETSAGTDVLVCTQVVDGRPTDVTAIHSSVSECDVASDIVLQGTARRKWTSEPCHVYQDESRVVHVRAGFADEGPLYRLRQSALRPTS